VLANPAHIFALQVIKVLIANIGDQDLDLLLRK
jgi:hypothetical protein